MSVLDGGLGRDRSWMVIAVLLLSLLMRWVLILRGGQYYISDETRYEVSRAAAQSLLKGHMGEALHQLLIAPEHLGFKVVGIIPALLESLTGPSLVLPAMFFSLFSVLNLYLLFLLARRNSSSSNEPFYALFIAACCFSLLYYSRHLFPYDTAMAFGLLALLAALVGNQSSRASLACGGLSFLCFITYNGYWSLAGFAMLANVVVHAGRRTEAVKKTIFTALGFLAPLLLLIVVMHRGGTEMLAAYRLFATSITQGRFEEGWSLPFEYFWHTERLSILILGALVGFALSRLSKNDQPFPRLWAGGVLFIYGCLLTSSVFLHWFVVYARLARQMIPFLVLLSAHGLVHLEGRKVGTSPVVTGLLALLFIQAVLNFRLAYQLEYPRQFSERLQAEYRDFEFSTKRMAFGAPTVCRSNNYAIENAKYFLSAPQISLPIRGDILREALHPVNFLPYQYEGYTPEQRQEFRKQQLKMKFYRVDAAFAVPANPDWTSIKMCTIPGE